MKTKTPYSSKLSHFDSEELQAGEDQSLGAITHARSYQCALQLQEIAVSRNAPSLLICLHETRPHYWLAGFFIQQLPVNKPCCQAPSHPPPLISRDLHLTSLCTTTITSSFLERVIAAFLKAIFRGSDHRFKGFNLLPLQIPCLTYHADHNGEFLGPCFVLVLEHNLIKSNQMFCIIKHFKLDLTVTHGNPDLNLPLLIKYHCSFTNCFTLFAHWSVLTVLYQGLKLFCYPTTFLECCLLLAVLHQQGQSETQLLSVMIVQKKLAVLQPFMQLLRRVIWE